MLVPIACKVFTSMVLFGLVSTQEVGVNKDMAVVRLDITLEETTVTDEDMDGLERFVKAVVDDFLLVGFNDSFVSSTFRLCGLVAIGLERFTEFTFYPHHPQTNELFAKTKDGAIVEIMKRIKESQADPDWRPSSDWCSRLREVPTAQITLQQFLPLPYEQFNQIVQRVVDYSDNEGSELYDAGLLIAFNHMGNYSKLEYAIYDLEQNHSMARRPIDRGATNKSFAEMAPEFVKVMTRKVKGWLTSCNHTATWGDCYYDKNDECKRMITRNAILPTLDVYKKFCFGNRVWLERSAVCDNRTKCDKICSKADKWTKCNNTCSGHNGYQFNEIGPSDEFAEYILNCPSAKQRFRECSGGNEDCPAVWSILLFGFGLLLLVVLLITIFAVYWFCWRTPKPKHMPMLPPMPPPMPPPPPPPPPPPV